MLVDGQGTKCRRNIAGNYNRLSKVHERYRRQTDRRQTDGRQHTTNVNVTFANKTELLFNVIPKCSRPHYHNWSTSHRCCCL